MVALRAVLNRAPRRKSRSCGAALALGCVTMSRERFLLCLGLLFGCSEDADERTRADFCADWASAACSEETVSACQAVDAAACEKSQTTACLELVPENFSDAKGGACIDAVKSAYQDGDLRGDELPVVFNLSGPCALIVKGPGLMGDDCSDDSDCNAPDGFSCVRKSTDEDGTCQKPVVVGAGRDCSAAAEVCDKGFFCDGENCIESRDAGRDCTFPGECASGLFCNDDGKCEAGRKVSEACDADEECESGVCLEDGAATVCTDRVVLARSEPICDTLR